MTARSAWWSPYPPSRRPCWSWRLAPRLAARCDPRRDRLLGQLTRGAQVEVIAFSDEEGVRFQSTFLGSKAVAGTLPAVALNVTDEAGMTLAQARCCCAHLAPVAAPDCGQQVLHDGTASRDDAALFARVQRAAAAPGSVRAYVEVHIEQGPLLEALGVPLGVVSGIAGQTRLAVSVAGEQGHAGTVPMRVRKDALAGAADAILAIERLCRGACAHALARTFWP
jgi:allantoate deiminase